MNIETPQHWTKEVILEDNTKVLLRPERKSDLDMLKSMFLNLTEETLRNYDTEFTEEMIEGWISNLDYNVGLPIVAVFCDHNGQERIVSVASLNFDSSPAHKHKTEFAITVHDDFQNKGLGTIIVNHMVEIARNKGLKKVFLRVDAKNQRAIHVYRKCGFVIEGKLLMNHWNYLSGNYGDDYQMAILM